METLDRNSKISFLMAVNPQINVLIQSGKRLPSPPAPQPSHTNATT